MSKEEIIRRLEEIMHYVSDDTADDIGRIIADVNNDPFWEELNKNKGD